MQSSLKQYVITQGIIFGFIHTILFYLIYFIDRSFLVSFAIGFLFLAFVAIYPIVAAVRYRNRVGGYLTLKDSFSLIFFMSFIRSLIITAFTLLLFQVIDPDLGKYLTEAVSQKTLEMMEKFGTPQDKIDETMAKMPTTDAYSVMQQLKGLLTGTIFLAVFALIIGAIIKKNPPPFAAPVSATPSAESSSPDIQN